MGHARGELPGTHKKKTKHKVARDFGPEHGELHKEASSAAVKLQALARGKGARTNPLKAAYGKCVDFKLFCHLHSHPEKEHAARKYLGHREMSVKL